MPRGIPGSRRTAPADIVDDRIQDTELPGLEADPKPGQRRRGRPRGSSSAVGAKTKILARSSTGKVLSRSAMIGMVATEIHAAMSMLVSVWAFKDPECAGSFQDTVMTPDGEKERIEAIAEQIAAIIGRNDALLATMASGGIVLNIGMLVHLFTGPVKAIVKAHGPGGHGHRNEEGPDDQIDYSQYNAPSLIPSGA